MDPVTAGLITGGVDSATSLGGQFISGYQNRKSQKRAAKYQRWNSAWAATQLPSLRVQGLRKAGLNPVLAAGIGNAGQLPASPAPSASGSVSGGLSSGLSRFMEAQSRKKGLELQDKQIALTEASTAKELAQTARDQAHTQLYSNLSSAASFDALNKSYEAYKNMLTKNIYESDMGQKFLPIMRALNESGLSPQSVMYSGAGLAGAAMNALSPVKIFKIFKELLSKKKTMGF